MPDGGQLLHPAAALRAMLTGFIEQGGPLLVVIMLATFFLWLLILERHYYFLVTHKAVVKTVIAQWQARQDKSSWYARQIRRELLSTVRIRAETNLAAIRLVVALAPLLGLLGTITGMIGVFDVMATTGTGNARGMAAGVSRATVPTMAGMVVSLTGLLFSVALQRRAAASLDALSNELVVKEGA